ncbi:hypothetical protein ARMGADRAFT_327844 [Armillaria gallica]|uniref:Uncharacterized protein n=1 Tax=Armillaria gallica TaxID=47427 RepID=A0A2H3DMZ4_ARMGA|nr:hypothetical protein ARMGADRAFT_327844 [Armillaria gallica]
MKYPYPTSRGTPILHQYLFLHLLYSWMFAIGYGLESGVLTRTSNSLKDTPVIHMSTKRCKFYRRHMVDDSIIIETRTVACPT